MATVGYGDGGPAAPMGAPPGCPGHPLLPATTPPSRSTSWMAARMVPPVSTHWSTRRMRRPGRGQRLRLSARYPCQQPDPATGATHWLTRRDGVGADLHHLLSARVVGVGLRQRLHAEVPGFADGQETFLQYGGGGSALRVGTALSGPQGRGMGTQRSPASPLTQDEAHGVNAGHHVNGVSLEGLQQVGHAVLQALGRESGGAGCPQPTVGTRSPCAGARGHGRVPWQPRGGAAHPGTPTGAIPPQALGTCG